MRTVRSCLAIFALSVLSPSAQADFDFVTASTATQTITSPLVANGMINLNATGFQHFTISPSTGFANVTSSFQGNDFLTAFGAASYTLTNTQTSGTVTVGTNGVYTVSFQLLFELKITSGVLTGVTFDTLTNALFRGTTATLPFPNNTVFGDPARPNDAVAIYLEADPNGVLASLGVPIGASVGTSSNRVVTALNVVPEPGSLGLLTLAGLSAAGRVVVRQVRSAVKPGESGLV